MDFKTTLWLANGIIKVAKIAIKHFDMPPTALKRSIILNT